MHELWIRLNELPEQGAQIAIPHQNFWTERFDAFGMGIKLHGDLSTLVWIKASKHSAVIKGKIFGIVQLSCDRCSELFDFPVNIFFNEFETKKTGKKEQHASHEFDALLFDSKEKFSDSDLENMPNGLEFLIDTESSIEEQKNTQSRLFTQGKVFYCDLGAILWEQLMLNLPVKPLCSVECKGVCPHCGINLNMQECSCAGQGQDPRLALFRTLKVK